MPTEGEMRDWMQKSDRAGDDLLKNFDSITEKYCAQAT